MGDVKWFTWLVRRDIGTIYEFCWASRNPQSLLIVVGHLSVCRRIQGLKRGSRARYLFREDRQTIVWDVISTIEMWSPPGKRVISAFHWLSMSLKLFAWNPPGILVRAGQNEVISEACPSLSSKGLSWAIHHGQCMQPEKTIKRARAIPRKNPQSHPCHDCWTCGQHHLPHIIHNHQLVKCKVHDAGMPDLD